MDGSGSGGESECLAGSGAVDICSAALALLRKSFAQGFTDPSYRSATPRDCLRRGARGTSYLRCPVLEVPGYLTCPGSPSLYGGINTYDSPGPLSATGPVDAVPARASQPVNPDNARYSLFDLVQNPGSTARPL